MLLTFRNINIPIAASKTQGPVKVFDFEFMGIILDIVSGWQHSFLPIKLNAYGQLSIYFKTNGHVI